VDAIGFTIDADRGVVKIHTYLLLLVLVIIVIIATITAVTIIVLTNDITTMGLATLVSSKLLHKVRIMYRVMRPMQRMIRITIALLRSHCETRLGVTQIHPHIFLVVIVVSKLGCFIIRIYRERLHDESVAL
jgi:hypothetical protein